MDRKSLITLAAAPLLFFPFSALAAETVTYSYDALGRLVRTVKSGGPSSGVDAQTSYDKVGNRTNMTVSGASNTPPPPSTPARVIVLPFNGITIIPISN